MNMPQQVTRPDLDVYRPALQRWIPKAGIRLHGKTPARFDGVIAWKTAGRTIRYLVEEKRHLRHQDIGVENELHLGAFEMPLRDAPLDLPAVCHRFLLAKQAGSH